MREPDAALRGVVPGSGRLGRRGFLRVAWAAIPALLARPNRDASAAPARRALALRNLHTGESLRRVYWEDGHFVPDALRDIDRVLRDYRTGEVHEIDRGLLQLLSDLRSRLDTAEPFEVISGYRSPATNALLQATTTGVASNSLHPRGMAVDVRVPGRPLPSLRAAAFALARGGVGYYPESDFVHIDVGRVRLW
jgi:uncharacterized protein YcbK (DUF882 family)